MANNFATLVLVGALAGVALLPKSAMESGGPVPPPTGKGVYIGAYQPDAPFNPSDLSKLIELTGKKPAILLWYQPWGSSGGRSDFPTKELEALDRDGIVALIKWEPRRATKDPRDDVKTSPPYSPYRVENITKGYFDEHIRTWARAARNFGKPFMLAPMHEMNGKWYPWGGTVNGNTPKKFIAAWRHIYNIFAQEKADNVAFVWSVNNYSVPRTANNAAVLYYPGGKYVDWVGISGFNWGEPEPFPGWMDVEEAFGPAYRKLSKYGKPIILTEFSSVEDARQPKRKADWIADTFRRIPDYPLIKAIIWFNAKEGFRDFRIESSPSSRKAFEKAVSNPMYLSDVTPDAPEHPLRH